MLLYFDTNSVIDDDRYALSCRGTLRDLAFSQVELQEGMSVTLYANDDEDENRRPCRIFVDAVVERRDDQFIARIDHSTWRCMAVYLDDKKR